IRGTEHTTEGGNNQVDAFLHKALAVWERMEEPKRYVVIGVGGAFVLAILLACVLVVRIKRARAAEAWAARVAPSPELLAEQDAWHDENGDLHEATPRASARSPHRPVRL